MIIIYNYVYIYIYTDYLLYISSVNIYRFTFDIWKDMVGVRVRHNLT
jgi:hypothetical protein